MVRNITVVGIILLLLSGAGIARSIMVKSHETPLEVGTYGRYRQNQAIFMWTPFDSMRTHWDLTQYPGGYSARVGLRPASEGRPPAPDSMRMATILQKDTLGSGAVQDIYLYKTNFGFYIDGIDVTQQQFRFIGNYQPDYRVYTFPVYRGAGWMTEFQWVYELLPGVFIVFNQKNTKRIVAEGKVKVPMSGDYYWPCLVIRNYYEFRDNMGSTPQLRWIYEWLVPGRFSGANGIAAALSQNGASPDFLNVEQFLQLEYLSVPGWDMIPPTFEDAVELSDTSDTGPFVVSTKILDNEAVGPESLFYRVNEGSWTSVGSDSSDGDAYFYTIPEVSSPARVDYFYWAMDEFSAAESIEIWTTWPVCSPESTMITFNVEQVGLEDRPAAPGLPAVRVGPNPFTGSTRFSVSLPGAEPAELRLYSTTGRLVRSLTLYPDARGRAERVWDGTDFRGRRLAAGTYLWQVGPDAATARGKLVLER